MEKRSVLPAGLEADLGQPEDINWRCVDIGEAEVTVPQNWSETAARILYQKYMRKDGVPSRRRYDCDAAEADNPEFGAMPAWLQPRKPDYTHEDLTFGGETSAHEVFERIAGHWTYSAWVYGYIDSESEAKTFYTAAYMGMAKQVFAPNSPQFFNTGLWWAYGLKGASIGHHPLDAHDTVSMDGDGYRKPQTSACFILGVEDNLVETDGIFDTLMREAQIFKYGSGAGANFSKIRHKDAPLSSGGKSSGLLSFLKVLDHAAGAIKSGGTTRRAAKMVVVDAHHPDAVDFARCKDREEQKIKMLQFGAAYFDENGDPAEWHQDLMQYLQGDWETEAHDTVGFQNANNSIRFTNSDMVIVERYIRGEQPRNCHEGYITEVWEETVRAAHACGDPGVQFDTNCNDWHTIPQAGRQNATNPCSEFSFLDNSACNLASINVMAFFNPRTGVFNTAAYERMCQFVTTILDITVSMSSYPTEAIALNSYRYRPLGLGLTNIGTLLMCLGLPYASPSGMGLAGALAAQMQASAWWQSNILAHRLAPLSECHVHLKDLAKVKDSHQTRTSMLMDDLEAAFLVEHDGGAIAKTLANRAESLFKQCDGVVRNAQLTLMAPTGTISFVMDCDTTGIEPDFALAKTKKLAGGGELVTVNQAVETALERLGYNDDIHSEAMGALEEEGDDAFLNCLDKADQPIFHTAGRIHWQDHVRMMAAVQPFLSGAISKTVNMPADATKVDVANAYMMAWRSGLKALAIYRDGSKTSQPMTAGKTVKVEIHDDRFEVVEPTADMPDESPVKLSDEIPPWDDTEFRSRLPATRRGTTVSAKIDGHRVYLRTGEYEDGRIGEVFLTIAKAGSALRTYVDALAVCLSIGLQYGVPPSEYIEAMRHTKSDPSGMVIDDPHIRFCSSVLDWAARTLERLCKQVNQVETVVVNQGESTGESCPECGAYSIYPSGTCLACASCGWTGGCS